MRPLLGRIVMQRCLSGRRSTTGNRVYLARVPWVQIPFSAPKKHSFFGCFFIFLRFYAEFSIFVFAKRCTRMCVYSKRYFYIAMPCKALANIHVYTALRAPCNERVPQVVQMVSGAKLMKCTAHNAGLIREHLQAVGALRFLP